VPSLSIFRCLRFGVSVARGSGAIFSFWAVLGRCGGDVMVARRASAEMVGVGVGVGVGTRREGYEEVRRVSWARRKGSAGLAGGDVIRTQEGP
jgi:hypothetical protein